MKIVLVTTIAVLMLYPGIVWAQDRIEKEKIQFLISSIENMDGARFIRNGSEYEAQKAANHLRRKLRMADDKVQTAEDFIRYCASQSLISGKPYMIRFQNGKTIRSEDYFREKLKEFEPQTE